jgi:hypothetical protein
LARDFPGCRCADWPKARKSFSGGDFAGKGQYGDVGDYAQEPVTLHGPKVGDLTVRPIGRPLKNYLFSKHIFQYSQNNCSDSFKILH